MRIATIICLTLLLSSMVIGGQEYLRPPTPLGLDEYFYIPEDNPLTREKVELGRRIFNERMLSSDRSISCASCHKPELAFSDGLRVSVGVGNREGSRNTPAIINRGYGKSFLWDGQVNTLEEQALRPIQNPDEMNLSINELLTRLRTDANYTQEFQRAFSDGITSRNVARALASFVRSLRSGNSAFDKFQHGDQTALSTEARRGLEIFRGKANCVACHVGPNFTDEQFHNTGVAWTSERFTDEGRYVVTRLNKDRGAFKTPTLRDVARTAPYMHDGSLKTLQEVIDYYDRGGNPNSHLDPEIRPLRLTFEERRALITLLKSLTGN